MRHVVAFVLIVIACVCVPARPAEAQGVFLEWLERLSGPGPFLNKGVHVSFVCYGYEKSLSTSADPDLTDEKVRPGVFRDQGWFFQPGCGKAARNVFRIAVGAQWSHLSGLNTLTADPSDTLSAQQILGTIDFGVHNSFEFGFAVGTMEFRDLPVDSFNRLSIQPVRVIVKPLAFFPRNSDKPYRREVLQVRFIGSWLPERLRAEDFGGVPGSFEASNEIEFALSIVFNFFSLLDR